MQGRKPLPIAPETWQKVVKTVTDALASVEGLVFTPGEAEKIARRLVQQRLAAGELETFLQARITSTDIAAKLTGLQAAFQTHDITMRDVFFLLHGHPNLFTSRLKTIEDKINLVADMLMNGDLPPPGTGQPQGRREALKIIFGNSAYSHLLLRSDDEIRATALLAQLAGCSVDRAIRLFNNQTRAAEINRHLAVISDRKWERVAPLAKAAGFKRPQPVPPDRMAMMKAAQARLAAKKGAAP